jgi:hypothetical protein
MAGGPGGGAMKTRIWLHRDDQLEYEQIWDNEMPILQLGMLIATAHRSELRVERVLIDLGGSVPTQLVYVR